MLKAMYGTRTASKLFGDFVVTVMLSEGCSLIAVVAMTFYNEKFDFTVSCHGDDFFGEAEGAGADELDRIMKKHFDVKILPRIGPSEFGGQTTQGLTSSVDDKPVALYCFRFSSKIFHSL